MVQYREGRRLESDDYEYAGVFVANEISEQALRQSETPVHDDWTSAALSTKADKIIVNAVLRRTKALQDEYAVPNAAVAPSVAYQGLGALAHELGLSLLPGAEGDGSGSDRPKMSTMPGTTHASHPRRGPDSSHRRRRKRISWLSSSPSRQRRTRHILL